MRMQMAMSICTGLKPQAGDGMGEKKERGRFTLRFNEGDPIHEAAIGLLELQSPRTKAQISTARLVEKPAAPMMLSTAQEVGDDPEMDDRMRSLIAGTLSAFRSRG